MSTPNEYALGADVRCEVIFKNLAGVETDPTSVYFTARDPEGEVVGPYTYGGGEIVKTAPGRFYVLIDANKSGTWIYRFYSTGAVKAADEDRFTVEESAFA